MPARARPTEGSTVPATVHEAGDLIWIAPTTAPGDSLDAETGAVLAALGRALATNGSSWDDVELVITYLAAAEDAAAAESHYRASFTGTPPRRTLAATPAPPGARVAFEIVGHRQRRPAAGDLSRRTGFVHHDGERLYFEVVGGTSTRPALVLCHGAGSNHASWFQQVHALALDRPVITWDHRGYGRSSDRNEQSGPAAAPGDLLAILDELEVERVDLVGQSMGGWTAVGATLARPHLVRSLTLTDSIGGIVTDAIIARLAHDAARDPAHEVLGDHPALGATFRHRAPALAHLYQMVGAIGSVDPHTMIDRLVRATHGPAEAAQLTLPVLCVVGDHDRIFPPSVMRAVAEVLPNACVVEIADAGHSAYFEQPSSWNRAVRDFLVALDRADAG
ncbi:MAG: alpha/beta fold hydrolase [Acidimicrobiales bacterium]